jgi:hypothetical protein
LLSRKKRSGRQLERGGLVVRDAAHERCAVPCVAATPDEMRSSGRNFEQSRGFELLFHMLQDEKHSHIFQSLICILWARRLLLPLYRNISLQSHNQLACHATAAQQLATSPALHPPDVFFGLKPASQRCAFSADVSKSNGVIIGAVFEDDQNPSAPSTTGTDCLQCSETGRGCSIDGSATRCQGSQGAKLTSPRPVLQQDREFSHHLHRC